MNVLRKMRKTIVFFAVSVLAAYSLPVLAQEDKLADKVVVSRDTVVQVAPTETWVKDSVLEQLVVVTNKFSRNWFAFGTVGAHTFRGDHSGLGSFGGTISPDFSVGIGKWFTPGIGVKLEFIRSNSRGYTTNGDNRWGYYSYGDKMITSDGTPYWKMKTNWWDFSIDVMFNISRLIKGYEGYGNPQLMNQFYVNAGIGAVHHLLDKGNSGSDNEWSGHLELQYSRFLTRNKHVSLDFKLRALAYESNFDLEFGQYGAAKQFDFNLGANVGVTFYLSKGRNNGWSRDGKSIYMRDFRNAEIQIVTENNKASLVVVPKTLTFYVFYPNNYSGRNDAPIVADAPVNAVDYLAGGIFTQKKYAENVDVSSRITSGASLNDLKVVDLPTERANKKFAVSSVPRGYELSEKPLSLSLNPKDMASFYNRAGYYYAPIHDGSHTWNYRIDDATLGQQLMYSENYFETNSYGLNAHRGLPTVIENLKIETGEVLVSFADVYAAMTSNEGYISQFTDKKTVDFIKKIFDQGEITMIQAEGVATSQDNYDGDNAAQIIRDRNEALSQNRAQTVVSWLKSKEKLNDVSSRIFMVNSLKGGIRTVTDTSTRGLNAKLSRCVKIRIHYLLTN